MLTDKVEMWSFPDSIRYTNYGFNHVEINLPIYRECKDRTNKRIRVIPSWNRSIHLDIQVEEKGIQPLYFEKTRAFTRQPKSIHITLYNDNVPILQKVIRVFSHGTSIRYKLGVIRTTTKKRTEKVNRLLCEKSWYE